MKLKETLGHYVIAFNKLCELTSISAKDKFLLAKKRRYLGEKHEDYINLSLKLRNEFPDNQDTVKVKIDELLNIDLDFDFKVNIRDEDLEHFTAADLCMLDRHLIIGEQTWTK